LASIDALDELVALTLRGESTERHAIVRAILDSLQQQQRSDRIVLVRAAAPAGNDAATNACRAVSDACGAIATRGGDDTATLLAVGPMGESPRATRRVIDTLTLLHAELAARGVTFVQSMRESAEQPSHLLACGYERLAILDYLVASVGDVQQQTASLLPAMLHFIPWPQWRCEVNALESPAATPPSLDDEATLAALVELVDATYLGSLDCPRIAAYRSTREALLSYRQSPHHRDDLWLIALTPSGRPVGCVLTTPHPPAGILELTYMGLIPEFRGGGRGRLCLKACAALARQCGATTLTLAVDQENAPAQRLYWRTGFTKIFSEAVWGRSLIPRG
jgi:ribosomal protein S18 acetylase RimI-like enzyme